MIIATKPLINQSFIKKWVFPNHLNYYSQKFKRIIHKSKLKNIEIFLRKFLIGRFNNTLNLSIISSFDFSSYFTSRLYNCISTSKILKINLNPQNETIVDYCCLRNKETYFFCFIMDNI